MEKYVPDMYQKDIFSINYDTLLSRGIKLLIFDLDNTIALVNERHASDNAIALFQELNAECSAGTTCISSGIRAASNIGWFSTRSQFID